MLSGVICGSCGVIMVLWECGAVRAGLLRTKSLASAPGDAAESPPGDPARAFLMSTARKSLNDAFVGLLAAR